jgi:hypothetical protein
MLHQTLPTPLAGENVLQPASAAKLLLIKDNTVSIMHWQLMYLLCS